jgi:hypothetical protein
MFTGDENLTPNLTFKLVVITTKDQRCQVDKSSIFLPRDPTVPSRTRQWLNGCGVDP